MKPTPDKSEFENAPDTDRDAVPAIPLSPWLQVDDGAWWEAEDSDA